MSLTQMNVNTFISDGFIKVETKSGADSIEIKDIIFIESAGNYVKLFTSGKTHLIKMTTERVENMLPRNSFLRIHKSFIVNKNKVNSFGGDVVILNERILPIGKTFKRYVAENLSLIELSIN